MNKVVKYTPVAGMPATASAIDHKATIDLTRNEQELIVAALQPKITELSEEKVVGHLIASLTTIYTIAGQKPDPNLLAIYGDEFYRYMMRSYPAMTCEEIRAALRAGIYADRGEENKYYGLNVKTFVQFIREYLNSDERKLAKEKFEENRLMLAVPKIEMTPEQRNQDNKDFVNHLYNEFRQGTLTTEFVPVHVYEFLDSCQVMYLSKERKQQLYAQAKSIRKKSLVELQKDELGKGFYKSAELIRETLDRFSSGNLPHNEKGKIQILAKQLAVELFFEMHHAWSVERIFE